MRFYKLLPLLIVLVSMTLLHGQTPQPDKIDWDKARQLRQRFLKGEKLSEEESVYLERAKKALKGKVKDTPRRPPPSKPPAGLKPLSDMSAEDRYKGEDGGLYGGGKNEPPEPHRRAALDQAKRIQPLNAEGKPAQDGKIVMISNGMSNTTQVFSEFVRLANNDPAKAANLVLVDGAQGGMEAQAWAQADQLVRLGRPDPWHVLQQRLKQAGATPAQVQAVWIKQARRSPASLGEFPKHAEEMNGHMVVILQKLKERFPNLRIAYLSSRTYAGYATTALNPEPYAYESAFAVRRLIQRQMKGAPELNFDAGKGAVKAPLLLWGPYLWADGEKGRTAGDLLWKPEDFAADGTHPGQSGRRKVAELLLRFMKNDASAQLWFTN